MSLLTYADLVNCMLGDTQLAALYHGVNLLGPYEQDTYGVDMGGSVLGAIRPIGADASNSSTKATKGTMYTGANAQTAIDNDADAVGGRLPTEDEGKELLTNVTILSDVTNGRSLTSTVAGNTNILYYYAAGAIKYGTGTARTNTGRYRYCTLSNQTYGEQLWTNTAYIIAVKDKAAQPMESITITNAPATFSTAMKLLYTYAPAAAKNNVVGSSGDTSIITVNANGKITPVAAGTTTITVACAADLTVKDTVTIEVVPAIDAIVHNEEVNVGFGSTGSLTYTVTPTTVPDAGKAATWSSADSNIISITADGIYEAKAEGTTTLTVTSDVDSTKFDTFTVTVRSYKEPTSIIPNNYLTLTSEGASQLTCNNIGNRNVNLYISEDLGVTWYKGLYDLPVPAYNTLYLAGINASGLSTSYDNYIQFVNSDSNASISGDIMSLVEGDKTTMSKTVPSECCFYNLFKGTFNDVNGLVLSPTTLTAGCYNKLFTELPITSLAASVIPSEEIKLAEKCFENFCSHTNIVTCDVVFNVYNNYAPFMAFFNGFCENTSLTTVNKNMFASIKTAELDALYGVFYQGWNARTGKLVKAPTFNIDTFLGDTSLISGRGVTNGGLTVSLAGNKTLNYIRMTGAGGCTDTQYKIGSGTNATTQYTCGYHRYCLSTGIFVKRVDVVGVYSYDNITMNTSTNSSCNAVPKNWTVVNWDPATDTYCIASGPDDTTMSGTPCDEWGTIL